VKVNPVLLDFPSEFETKRLLIRMPLPGDGAVTCESINASLKELKPWMPFAQKEQSVEETEIVIRQGYINFLNRSDLRLLVFKKDTGEFVASSGLHRINWDVPKFEIGYWIDTRFSGKGYMTEAVQGITDFAVRELKARRIEIRCDSLNTKSKAIPERLGFTLDGILKNDSLSVDGELRDTCIYSKVF
jgi:ribosomal-protein-serine acetyltransferase